MLTFRLPLEVLIVDKWFAKIRKETIDVLGGKCVKCGFDDWRALQVDHINGDGVKDRVKSGTSYYYHILKNINSGRYQVLCANCNVIKRREKQECPLDAVVTADYDEKGNRIK